MSLTQSLLPVVALMAARAVSATAGNGESNSENSVEKCPVSIQRFGSGLRIKVKLGEALLIRIRTMVVKIQEL